MRPFTFLRGAILTGLLFLPIVIYLNVDLRHSGVAGVPHYQIRGWPWEMQRVYEMTKAFEATGQPLPPPDWNIAGAAKNAAVGLAILLALGALGGSFFRPTTPNSERRGRRIASIAARIVAMLALMVYLANGMMYALEVDQFVADIVNPLKPGYGTAAPFEPDIAKFEAADRESDPPKDAILFLGSSSIRMWAKLKEDMAPLPVLNRGFGGSKIPHILHFYDRIVLPYKPRKIVFYAGENDIHQGASPEKVANDFKAFAERVRKDLPETTIYFLSIKPCPARMHTWPAMKTANARIQMYIKETPGLVYLDVAEPMMQDGEPLPELYKRDRIHMNDDGYAIWKKIVKPALLVASKL